MIEHVGGQRFGVVSTVGPEGAPQSAFLFIAATDRGELVFDAKPDSRKVANLRRDPRIAMVVGGADGTTLQCEGIADFPQGGDLERCAAAYLAAFPEFSRSIRDGSVIVIRVALEWARYGDYRGDAPDIHEIPMGSHA